MLVALWAFEVTSTLADPSVSSYCIGGFSRLDVAMLRYAVLAGISSRPSETLALDLLEDNRAARSIALYEAHLRDKVELIETIPASVFQLLARLIDMQRASSIRGLFPAKTF